MNPPPRRSTRTLWLILGVCLAPVVLSYAAFYLLPSRPTTNYGELVASPAPPVAGTLADGRRWSLADERGRWVLLVAAAAPCDAACERALYATRQARTIQGREQERVRRVWLAGDGAAAAPAEQADLLVVGAAAASASALPGGGRSILLVDPLGNVVLAWPSDPDIKAMAKDLGRVLRASRIG
jgi:hypothetical protein